MDNIRDRVHNDFVKLRENKGEYFGDFYNNNYKLVYRICFSVLKNTENSEDMAQSVFEKILKMKENQYPTEYESSWLYTVSKNECLQLIRKTKAHQNENQDEEVLENVKSDTNEIEDAIENEDYKKMVKKLNKKQEQIVSLKVISDFTFKEIGQIMSMPIATVQWYYYSSIKSLKAAMANFAMFLIALVIGIKYMGKEEVSSKKNNSDNINKDQYKSVENESSSISASDASNESNTGSSSKSNRSVDNVIAITETSTSQDSIEATNNNVSIGIFSVSGIFLALTIIFSIIFIKYQQKGNKKTSKK
ncbi:MAG: sigma-70 family RNA polymerase sigma factor [Clostridia bacterium]|nr:sigma-70 family RNA polymerase sigma factor [Clostridia bacterium]